MSPHLKNLLTLIRQARQRPWPGRQLYGLPEPDMDEISEPENRSYSDRLLHGRRIPVSRITGIDFKLLPEPEKLNDQQKALLANELETLLLFYHFRLDFPAKFPMTERYPFIFELWKEKHIPVPAGENHIGFCDFDLKSCPFPQYCSICHVNSSNRHYVKTHD
jgi:hypothetical protein